MRQVLARARRWPVAREPLFWIELFAIANLAFLAVDIFVAHSINRFAHWAEWIPFVFSLVSPCVMILAMALQRSFLPPTSREGGSWSRQPGRWLGLAVGWGAILVGVSGLVLHLESQFFQEKTLESLVYTAPFVAPLSYTGIGLLLVLNRTSESDSLEWAQWVLILTLGGFIGNFVLSVADHAQNGFFYWREWIPVVSAALAVGFLVVMVAARPLESLIRVCRSVLVLQVLVGLAGAVFHVQAILSSPMSGLREKILFGAPLFAPLLFVDLALLGWIGCWALERAAVAARIREPEGPRSNAEARSEMG